LYGSASVWTAPDLYNTNYLLCVGGNPKVSHWTIVSVPNDNGDTLKQIKARGGKVQFVNPRKIESSTPETGDTLRIKPDTDVYLLAAILNELKSRDAFDHSIIEKHGKNVEGLLEFVAQYPAERVAPITGIDADTIREIASDYMAADGAIIYVATGVNMGRQGTVAYWIAEMINFLTGNLGRDGGMYRPAGFCKTDLPLPEQEVSIDTSVGTLSMAHNYNPMPTTVLPDLIDNGDIKALVVLTGNPLLSTPAESKLRESFKRLDVMVATDIMRTDTVELCDYVFPATDWLEREDIPMFSNGSQLRPYVQYTEAMVAPKYECRDDWATMSRLALELGPSELFERELNENGFAIINQMLAASDLSIDKLSQMPHQTAVIEQPPKEEFYQTDVHHTDGKIDCCPEDFIKAGLLERCEEIFKELEKESPDTLKLITMRTIHMHNGWLSNVPMFRKGINNLNPLNMSEEDAERLGLLDGDDIRVFNKFGSVETQVLINNDLRPGAVALTHGFGHKKAYGLKVASTKAGANYNQLVPTGAETHEPRSYMCWMTGVPVEVEPLNK
jgi:anaerobic selenocysteine-containing dehydrogenase